MILVLGLSIAAYVACLCLPDIYLLVIHLLEAQKHLAREQEELADLLPTPGREPTVCVQVPVHNEAALVGQIIDCLCAIEWPRNRLEIVVLDDCSTDGTAEIAARHIAAWRAKGVQVRLHGRTTRQDYKAGLLRDGLRLTEAKYIAIFDVDCHPHPRILRQLMTAMVAAPRIAFVQARLDHRNRLRNWLTRAQAIELDTFFAYEHASRHWAGIPVNFQGTNGLWRREAIEDAGGWQGQSLTEDVDLSFRAFARGWHCRILTSVSVAGYLPVSFQALSLQRDRWSVGAVQQLGRWPWALWRQLSAGRYLLFVMLWLFHATIRIAVVSLAVLAALASLVDPTDALILAAALLLDATFVVLTKTAGSYVAARLLGNPKGLRWALDVMLMWTLQLVLLPVACHAALKALFFRNHAFARTPKQAS